MNRAHRRTRAGRFVAVVLIASVTAHAQSPSTGSGQAYPSKPLEYAERNIFEDKYLGSAEFAEYLVKRRVEAEEFLRTIGVLKPATTGVP